MEEIVELEDDTIEYYVPFTQYFLPNGRKEYVMFDTTKEVADKAEDIIKNGFKFEVEVLTTGHVSATIHNIEHGIDVDILVCENKEEVIKEKINNMIMNFDLKKEYDYE